MIQKPFTVFICLGDPSADRYAAEITKTLLAKQPNCRVIAVASTHTKEAGAELVLDITGYSTVGILEPLRYVWPLHKALTKVKQLLRDENIDLFLPLDNQGFNLMCCRVAKEENIPIYYFISPQEWQWGTDEGGKRVLSHVDKILAIFPEENKFYKRLGGDSVFVGHPIIDRISPYKKERQAEKILSIFPGSRRQEIERMLPIFLKIAPTFAAEHQLKMVVSVSNPSYERLIKKIIKKHAKKEAIDLYTDNSLGLMAKASYSIVTSGTVSLEHALLGVPHIVAYKIGAASFFLLKTFMKRVFERVPYISMANLLLDRLVLPEYLQDKATEVNLKDGLAQLITDENKILKDCEALYKSLDNGCVSDRVVDEIIKLAKKTV